MPLPQHYDPTNALDMYDWLGVLRDKKYTAADDLVLQHIHHLRVRIRKVRGTEENALTKLAQEGFHAADEEDYPYR